MTLHGQPESLQKQTSDVLSTGLFEFIKQVEREATESINRQQHTLERVQAK